jgi:proteic killer suppression protein
VHLKRTTIGRKANAGSLAEGTWEMRAVICTGYGTPDVLRLVELKTPTPQKNEVRIRVFATEDLYHGRPTARARRIPRDVVDAALVKMDALNGAVSMLVLRSPPGNRFEMLKGDLRVSRAVGRTSHWSLSRSLAETGCFEGVRADSQRLSVRTGRERA